jgi:aspartyl-tRNA(Asn)/glutamyl-tRNA(Gln) amidotransferase subunit B
MPKNFQISQYDLPICVGGYLDVDVDGVTRRLGITRVHMEEDTGKTTHGSASGRIHEADYALIDYNRAGVPLVECVSEPDMRSPEEAVAYLRELRATLESLDVSDVRMEEGSLRCDANISLRPVGQAAFGTKVEIKNMNSVRSMERALNFEIARQTKAIENGEPIVQETRHWDEDAGATKSMRSKEEAFDYRYFPEPDIPPLEPPATWVDEIRATVPELPRARRERYVTLGLKPEVAGVLVADRASTDLFERTIALGADAKAAANWITQDVVGLSNKARLSGVEPSVSPEHLAEIIRLVQSGEVSASGAKLVLEELINSTGAIGGSGDVTVRVPTIEAVGHVLSPAVIVERLGLRQVSDAGELGPIVEAVIAEHPDVVEQFRGGKEGVIGFLVGQVMQKTANAANPKLAQELLRERLTG